MKITESILPILFLLCLCHFASGQKVLIDANGYIAIDCSDMPADAVTTISKGSGTGMVHFDNPTYLISSNGATVFRKIQIAKADTKASGPATGKETMSWSDAVGYSNPYTGNYPADTRLGTPAGTHNEINPNNTYTFGAPADKASGCNAYWEGAADDPITGVGKWRLPNKRELMLMWIFKAQLESISGFTVLSGTYWSASERASGNDKNRGHLVNFNNGATPNDDKIKNYKVRCIREIR